MRVKQGWQDRVDEDISVCAVYEIKSGKQLALDNTPLEISSANIDPTTNNSMAVLRLGDGFPSLVPTFKTYTIGNFYKMALTISILHPETGHRFEFMAETPFQILPPQCVSSGVSSDGFVPIWASLQEKGSDLLLSCSDIYDEEACSSCSDVYDEDTCSTFSDGIAGEASSTSSHAFSDENYSDSSNAADDESRYKSSGPGDEDSSSYTSSVYSKDSFRVTYSLFPKIRVQGPKMVGNFF